MGITPYINASIIMQLMTVVLPQLEEMAKKGGEEGRKKISQYTRWLTILLATMQATFMAISMERSGVFYDTSIWYLLYAIIAMVGGTLFLMWLGEQITDKGIGNGVSLIIFIGIVLRYPAVRVADVSRSRSQGAESTVSTSSLYIAIAILVTIISIVFLYQGQRRVPVQQARRVVGRKMFAGRSTLHSAAAEQRGRDLDHLRDLDPAAAAAGALVVRRSTVAGPGSGGSAADNVLGRVLNVWFTPERLALQHRVLLTGRRLHVLL